jgi:hypothetical protein
VRVLVGRLETITPEDCRELVHNLVGANANELPADDSIKEELKSLGRFAEPAIKFAITQTVDVETRKRLEVVLAKVHAGKI